MLHCDFLLWRGSLFPLFGCCHALARLLDLQTQTVLCILVGWDFLFSHVHTVHTLWPRHEEFYVCVFHRNTSTDSVVGKHSFRVFKHATCIQNLWEGTFILLIDFSPSFLLFLRQNKPFFLPAITLASTVFLKHASAWTHISELKFPAGTNPVSVLGSG